MSGPAKSAALSNVNRSLAYRIGVPWASFTRAKRERAAGAFAGSDCVIDFARDDGDDQQQVGSVWTWYGECACREWELIRNLLLLQVHQRRNIVRPDTIRLSTPGGKVAATRQHGHTIALHPDAEFAVLVLVTHHGVDDDRGDTCLERLPRECRSRCGHDDRSEADRPSCRHRRRRHTAPSTHGVKLLRHPDCPDRHELAFALGFAAYPLSLLARFALAPTRTALKRRPACHAAEGWQPIFRSATVRPLAPIDILYVSL